MKSMEEAHRADYADMRRMRDLTLTIEDFLDDPPDRCGAEGLLRAAVKVLRSDCAQIVRRWD